MKIFFIGAVEFSRRMLEALVAMDADIVGAATLGKSPFNSDYCDLKQTCHAHNIPCNYVTNINEDVSIKWIEDRKPDIIFCFGWSRLLGNRLLKLAPLGVVGFHPAALPKNRGRHPIVWALVLGLRETASTFFLMDQDVDNGDIISQKKIIIDDEDNASTLYEKISITAQEQLREILPKLASGDYQAITQDHKQANIWRKRTEIDGKIDWRMSGKTIYNLIRGLSRPYIGAHFIYSGYVIKVWKANIVNDVPLNIEPGKIINVTNRGTTIKCGEQGICLLETEPQFKPRPGEYL